MKRKPYSIYFSESERNLVLNHARTKGLSLGAYLRFVALEAVPKGEIHGSRSQDSIDRYLLDNWEKLQPENRELLIEMGFMPKKVKL